MLPIASIIKRSTGSTEFQDGSLYPLPAELTHNERIKPQKNINKPGWHNVDFGYQAYALRFRASDLLIFPWLIVEGSSKPTKRFPGYNQSFTKKQIEELGEHFVRYTEREAAAAQEDLNLLIHDLRGLSTTIQHQAYSAKNALEYDDQERALIALESLLATQSLLSLRTDALDFLGNPDSILDSGPIAFYKKVDRVCRSYRPRALAEKKRILLSGQSYGQIFGPNVFELVPFAIIDNAIKYSPSDRDINVEIGEAGGKAWFKCTSLGPRIHAEEKNAIFDRGKRGEAAIQLGKPGSGIGLNLIQRLVVDHFAGGINLSQATKPSSIDGFDYYETCFRVNAPLYDSDESVSD